MGINLKSVKTVSPNRKLIKKLAAFFISVIVFIVAFIIIFNANQDAKETIGVLRVKSLDGITIGTPVTAEMVENYQLIKKEYREGMLLSEQIDEIVNKYVLYYLRNESIIFQDQLTTEKPKKNEWLYELDEELEVVTIPYNYLECGGDILTPGDRVRIRAIYEGTSESGQSSDYNPNLGSFGDAKTSETDTIFDSIVVRDLLNSNSHSIYEVYKEVLKLPEDKKKEVMESKDFIKNIQPKALVLEGSREQIDTYAKYKGLSGSKSFVITILSRVDSDIIIDQLPTLESEVNTWIEKKDKK